MSTEKQTDYIRLDQFLKWKNIVASGGEAKYVIQEGMVSVNGELEIRRGRKLRSGDEIEVNGEVFAVELQTI